MSAVFPCRRPAAGKKSPAAADNLIAPMACGGLAAAGRELFFAAAGAGREVAGKPVGRCDIGISNTIIAKIARTRYIGPAWRRDKPADGSWRRSKANTGSAAASRRCTPASARAGPRKKDLPALLLAALNEPVTVDRDGRRRRISKREAIVAQLVDKSADADLRATKMLIDMPKDIERKVAPPPEAAAETRRSCKTSSPGCGVSTAPKSPAPTRRASPTRPLRRRPRSPRTAARQSGRSGGSDRAGGGAGPAGGRVTASGPARPEPAASAEEIAALLRVEFASFARACFAELYPQTAFAPCWHIELSCFPYGRHDDQVPPDTLFRGRPRRCSTGSRRPGAKTASSPITACSPKSGATAHHAAERPATGTGRHRASRSSRDHRY